MTSTRLLTLDDAPALAELIRLNRDFLAPYEPPRPPDHFTDEGQRVAIRTALGHHALGTALPHVIVDDAGRVVGRVTLNGIVHAPSFRSCSTGYWVGAADNGRGHATAAVREIVRVAFEELDLHRVQAETMLDNAASQRVLERNGFVRYGMAPRYLNLDGDWRDHYMYQVLNE